MESRCLVAAVDSDSLGVSFLIKSLKPSSIVRGIAITLSGDLAHAIFEVIDLAGVDEEYLASSGFRLSLVEKQDDAQRGDVVDRSFRAVEDALDKVVVREPLADGLFLVGAGVARTAGGGASVQDDGCAALSVGTGVDMLDPAPVGGRLAGEAGAGREAIELVVVVVGLGERALIPHGIGNDMVPFWWGCPVGDFLLICLGMYMCSSRRAAVRLYIGTEDTRYHLRVHSPDKPSACPWRWSLCVAIRGIAWPPRGGRQALVACWGSSQGRLAGVGYCGQPGRSLVLSPAHGC